MVASGAVPKAGILPQTHVAELVRICLPVPASMCIECGRGGTARMDERGPGVCVSLLTKVAFALHILGQPFSASIELLLKISGADVFHVYRL
jgi:hypothetical protein